MIMLHNMSSLQTSPPNYNPFQDGFLGHILLVYRKIGFYFTHRKLIQSNNYCRELKGHQVHSG